MGNGSSLTVTIPSQASRIKKDLLQTENERAQEDLRHVEESYPKPRPPRNKKSHILQPGKYSELEENARSATLDICLSWHSFVKYLTQGMTTDIEKVRSLFVWMGSQNFRSGKFPNGKEDSPLHLMRRVRRKTMSYAAFFVKICRAAELKAVVIEGVAKSVAYDVGDPLHVVQQLRNNWCAVYSKGDWRLIFPLWAFSAVEGRITDTYTLIDGGNFAKNPKVSPGTTVRKFNEFFFLTDPDVFVHFAFPDYPDWQLLAAPQTMDRFVQEPFFRQPFFTNQLQVATLLPGVQNAKNGISEISIRSLLNNWQGVLTHELYFHKRESLLKLPRKISFNKFVILDRSNKKWEFTIRFPINGVYKLTINGGVPPNDKEWICDFKLICQTAIEDIQPLPCNIGVVGFGPTNLLENMGIIEPSCKKGTILAKLRQQIYIGFTLTRKLLIRSEMVANKYTPSELQQNVTESITNQKLVVSVNIPEDGEYILRLFARENESVAEENVCNYFITTDDPRTYRKENAFEQKRQKELVKTTKDQKDLNDIEVVIENIDKLAPEDNGTSNKELTRPDFLKMRQESTEATDRRHCSILDKQVAIATKFEPELRETSRKVHAVREEVHATCVHGILEMNQSTVAELKWYRSPTPAILDTMKAVYIILGEDVDNLNTWDDIHFLLSKLGNDSLLNRVKKFQTTQIREHALEEADNLTQPHDLTSIKSKSPAAGTFYVWVRDLVKLKREGRKENMKPQKSK